MLTLSTYFLVRIKQTELESLLHYSHSNNIGVRLSDGIEGIR